MQERRERGSAPWQPVAAAEHQSEHPGPATSRRQLWLDQIGPFTISSLRFLVTLVVLASLAWRQGFHPALVFRRTFLLFGLIDATLYFGLRNLGLLLISAGNTALIQASIPAASALLATLILGARPGRRQLIGITLSVVGVLLVSLAWAASILQVWRLAGGYPALVITPSASRPAHFSSPR